jgi:hypothetical protein
LRQIKDDLSSGMISSDYNTSSFRGVREEFYENFISALVIPPRSFTQLRLLTANSAEIEVSMLDILFIAIGLGFLAAAMLYAVACDRL